MCNLSYPFSLGHQILYYLHLLSFYLITKARGGGGGGDKGRYGGG